MKELVINRTSKDNKFKIYYKGEYDNEVDLERINILIDRFLNEHTHIDMTENVMFLRTILKDIDEKELSISSESERGSEFVRYDNKELSTYEGSRKETICDEYRYRVKYEPNSGINLQYNNHEQEVIRLEHDNTISKEITLIVNHIYFLKHTHNVTLSRDDKILVEVYRLFYNENPDFSDKDINIKIQTMMFILSEYGISLGYDCDFTRYSSDKLPVSQTLEYQVDRLFPLGEITDPDLIKISKDYKKIIETIGKIVNEYAKDDKERLIRLVKIIYTGKYNVSPSNDINEISKYTNYPLEEVETNMKLVKRINDNM